MRTFKLAVIFSGLVCFLVGELSFADNIVITPSKVYDNHHNVVEQRTKIEEEDDANPFSILPYEPIYLLPFNYSSSASPWYQNNTPDDQKVRDIGVKFQISLKTPIWRNVFNKNNTLYLAYTQQSFWQAYTESPYFQANNFQPELFLENNVNWQLPFGWNLQLLTPGLVHQSNGRGGLLERSWNRAYLNGVFARGNWLVGVKPWYIVHDDSLRRYNPDIAHYLGHEMAMVSYRYHDHVFSVEMGNMVESGFHRGSVQLTWSYPLIHKIRGYAQFFSGYGQNLLEYNHHTNSFGLGIALNDWI